MLDWERSVSVWSRNQRSVGLTGQPEQVQPEPQPHEPLEEHPQSPMVMDEFV